MGPSISPRIAERIAIDSQNAPARASRAPSPSATLKLFAPRAMEYQYAANPVISRPTPIVTYFTAPSLSPGAGKLVNLPKNTAPSRRNSVNPTRRRHARSLPPARHGVMGCGGRWDLLSDFGREALGLRWRYVDQEAGVIKVCWQIQRVKWRHGRDDQHACGQSKHRKPCPPDCKRHKTGCPRPCPKDCRRHASTCPKRHGGGLHVASPAAQDAADRIGRTLWGG